MLYKTIAAPDRGVNYDKQSQFIDPREWTTLVGMRTKKGSVSNFPGWQNILASGQSLIGGYGTLCTQFEKFDGTITLVAAGTSKIYRYDPVAKTLIDMSGANVFNATRDDPWFDFFYKNIHYVVNKNDGFFFSDLVANYAALANAPKAKCGGVLHDHILAFNYNDGTDHPQGLKWSDEGLPTVWTPLASNSAGSFDLDDTADIGITMEPLGTDMILYKDRSIIPITWIGGNEVFARRQSIFGVGLNGIYAVGNTGDEHIIMGPDNFYLYSGGVEVDDEFARRIRRAVFPRLNPLLKNRARALLIEETREIVFAYCTVNAVNDCDEFVVFNYDDNTWYGPTPINRGISMMGFTTRATTLPVDSVPDIVDTVPIIVDQYPAATGSPFNLFVDSSGKIFNINEGIQSDDGNELVRVMESGDHFLGFEAQIENGKAIAIPAASIFHVNQVNIQLQGEAISGTIQFFLGHRMDIHDPITYDGPFTINLTASSFKLQIPVRATGRWFRIRFTIPQSIFFDIGGYQFEFNIAGRR
jgi:hypothetical protein